MPQAGITEHRTLKKQPEQVTKLVTFCQLPHRFCLWEANMEGWKCRQKVLLADIPMHYCCNFVISFAASLCDLLAASKWSTVFSASLQGMTFPVCCCLLDFGFDAFVLKAYVVKPELAPSLFLLLGSGRYCYLFCMLFFNILPCLLYSSFGLSCKLVWSLRYSLSFHGILTSSFPAPFRYSPNPFFFSN